MERRRICSKWTGLLSMALALAGAGLGCAAKQIEYRQPMYGRMFWRHITTQPAPEMAEKYQIVADRPTQGLFPANLGVTRVAVEILDEHLGLERPVLLTNPQNEFLRWNSALDDLFAVSEVFPISEFDLGGGPVEPEQILAAFRALDARLGLIYSVNQFPDKRSEVIGVLYDSATSEPIAYFHAEAKSIEPPEVIETEPRNLWKTDSEALARSRFERMVHSCIRALILQDEPADEATPTAWHSVVRGPVEWPPTKPDSGR